MFVSRETSYFVTCTSFYKAPTANLQIAINGHVYAYYI